MIRNNQNGRRRGRGGARPPQAGGGPSGNYGNSGNNRMDVRQRGNATQLLEKYKALARDATQGGDRVQAEYFMQYADHYYRVLNEFRARDPQPVQRGYDDDDSEANYNAQGQAQNYAAPQNYAPPQADGRYADEVDDDEGEDEAPRRQAAPVQNGGDRQNDRQDRVRGGQDQQRAQRSPSYARDDQRDGGQRDNGQRDGGNRDNNQRDAAPRDNGQREYQRDNGQRDNGQREYAPRDAAPRENSQQRDNGQQRETAPRENMQQRENGQQRDSQPRYAARAERAPREDRPARDDRNGDARANGDARSERSTPVRAEAPRESFDEPLIMTIPGLPGPATVAAPAPAMPTQAMIVEAAAPVTADAAPAGDEAPAPRRRGRPRKVVVTADESTGDA